MTQITIRAADSVMSRYGENLVAIGSKAPVVLSRAINHEGAKAVTQVRRALVRVTGIKASQVKPQVTKATQNRLAFVLNQRGGETNLNLFNARQTKTGVSATPWGQRHIFPHAFILAKFGNKVFIRTGPGWRDRFRQVYGPNIAREIVRGEPAAVFEAVMGSGLVDRVGHELDHLLRAGS